MYKRLLAIVACMLIALTSAWTRERAVIVKVTNPLKIERASETISISLEDLKKKLPSLNTDMLLVTDAKSGKSLSIQIADDELLFQSDFIANETKGFVIKNASASIQYASQVFGGFMEPRQDYAWENDKVAFRMYGPALAKEVNNGIDVWTKRVRHLIVQKWYKGDQDTGAAKISYHVDHGEGADFFSVGKTLGAGGCGIWQGDKVYQPGVFSSYKTIMNGPIRLVFELTYDSLNVEGKRFKEVKRISLDAGQHMNRIACTYLGNDPNEMLQVGVGLVKRKATTPKSDDKNGWFSLWGLTTEDTLNGSLGTGIVMPQNSFVKLTEDKDQYLIVARTKASSPLVYYAGAGWTKAGDFPLEDQWTKYLDNFALRIASPLKVRLSVK